MRLKKLKEEDLSEKEKNFLEDKKQPIPHAKPPIYGTKKARIILSDETKNKLKMFSGTKRLTFNESLSLIKNGHKISLEKLSDKLLPKNQIPDEQKWKLKTPKDIRKSGIDECVTAYKAAFTNLRNGNIDRFDIRFKSKKKEEKDVIPIPGSATTILENGIHIYTRYISELLKFKRKESFDGYYDYEIKIVHHKKTNKWYVHIPIYKEVVQSIENQDSLRTCSIDPGSRTPFSVFDTNGKLVKIGEDDMKKHIVPIYKRISKITSLRDRKIINKRKANRKLVALRLKLSNVKNEFHHKVSNYLIDNYDIIILPDFETKSMTKRGSKLRKETKRQLLSWNHCNMRRILADKLKYHTNIRIIVTEEYTTKTCDQCGVQNEHVGSSEVFYCYNCNLVADRDLHAARGILIKALVH